jgi:hypothetical protein
MAERTFFYNGQQLWPLTAFWQGAGIRNWAAWNL